MTEFPVLVCQLLKTYKELRRVTSIGSIKYQDQHCDKSQITIDWMGLLYYIEASGASAQTVVGWVGVSHAPLSPFWGG